MDKNERIKKVVEFISNNQYCTVQEVVDGLEKLISRGTIFGLLEELRINGVVKDNKNHENNRNHKLYVNLNNPLVSVPKELEDLQNYISSLSNKTKTFLDSYYDRLTEIEITKVDEMFVNLMVEILRIYAHRAFISWPRQIKDHRTLGRLHAEFSTRITEIQHITDDALKSIRGNEQREKDVIGPSAYSLLDEMYRLEDLLEDFEEFYYVKDESRRLLRYLLQIRAQEVGSDNISKHYEILCKKNDDPQAYRRSMKSARKSHLKQYKFG